MCNKCSTNELNTFYKVFIFTTFITGEGEKVFIVSCYTFLRSIRLKKQLFKSDNNRRGHFRDLQTSHMMCF